MADFGANMILKAKMDSSDFDQGMHRAQKSTKQFQDTTKKAQGQLRLMRGGLGQLGHQVQDVAVQLQMGQNAMLVFGQQGSQIASLMGPNGAIIGAVLAVGAAIATSLMPSLFGATQAFKDLEEQQKTLLDRFDSLTGALRLEALAQYAEQYKDTELAISKAEKVVAKYTKRIQENGVMFNYSSEQIAEFQREIVIANSTIALGKKQLDELDKKVDGTTDAYEKFAEKMVLSNIQMREGALGVQLYNIAISDMTLKEKVVASAQAESLHIQEKINKERQQAAKDAKALQLRQIMSGLNAEAQGIKKLQSERQRAEAKEISEAEAQQKRFESTRDQYTLQVASIGKTAEQLEILKLRQQELKPEQIAEIERVKELGRVKQEEYDAEVERQAAGMSPMDAMSDVMGGFESMDNGIKSSIMSTTSMVAGSVASTMTSISELFAKGSSEAKAFMLVSKGLEAANAIIAGLSGEMAIKAAYAKMALANPAMAGAYTAMGNVQGTLMKTMGFVNAGMIMGQAAASFDGGGFTGMGARAGGVDGKGGFPAILHPNETVIDHSKGQSMGTNVTINIQANDTKGFDELLRSRRGEIIGIVNKAINNRGVSSLI
jgi:hypothetical protein